VCPHPLRSRRRFHLNAAPRHVSSRMHVNRRLRSQGAPSPRRLRHSPRAAVVWTGVPSSRGGHSRRGPRMVGVIVPLHLRLVKARKRKKRVSKNAQAAMPANGSYSGRCSEAPASGKAGEDRTRNPEADIVVTVVWVVVVAVGRAEVLWTVVPRAAAKDTAGRSRQSPQTGRLRGNPAPIRFWTPQRAGSLHNNFSGPTPAGPLRSRRVTALRNM
jgi:hypothetical protein